ncbi:MAG: hypothetical protein J5510_08120 [Prevotella sp.]|nr:hypothetical protein [Prevotella sp.]
MQTFNITISKETIAKMMETLVYKYANSIDTEKGNYKGVRNVKSDRVDDVADALVVDGSFGKRCREVLAVVHEFATYSDSTPAAPVFSFSIPTRWNGKKEALQAHMEQYVLNGIMSDWLNVTAPSEAAIYTAKLPQDLSDIKVELYKKGTPV